MSLFWIVIFISLFVFIIIYPVSLIYGYVKGQSNIVFYGKRKERNYYPVRSLAKVVLIPNKKVIFINQDGSESEFFQVVSKDIEEQVKRFNIDVEIIENET